jgi:tRNA (mo5U34)-methyltransferase
VDTSIEAARRKYDRSAELAEKKGWYHSIELPGGRAIEGVISLETRKKRVAQFPIPDDLRGKRVLDIGAWDGWFSFEMERRGAEVVAVDCVDLETFRYAHRALGSKVDYRQLDVYEMTPERLGRFDIVLFLGVLYHLKHPVLGLERVCALTKDLAIVESYITDAEAAQSGTNDTLPSMEFYETDLLGDQIDNWVGPNLECLMAMARTAGFARVNLQGFNGDRACVACYRTWDAVEGSDPAPELLAAIHNRDYGCNFYSERDEYVSCSLRYSDLEPRIDSVFPEVDGLAARPVYVKRNADGIWFTCFRLPPGLEPGWHAVRLRIAGTQFSNSKNIAVDMPLRVGKLEIAGVADAVDFAPEIRSGFMAIWVRGLPENADCQNIGVLAGETRQPVIFLGEPEGEGQRQVNIKLRPDMEPGEQMIQVRVADAESEGTRAVIHTRGSEKGTPG